MKTVFFILFLYLLIWSPTVEARGVKMNLFELSRDSTVMIVSKSGNSKGTGFLIGDRVVMTCFHVIAARSVQGTNINWIPYNDLQVILPSGEEITGTLISVPTQIDPIPVLNDFALVKLKANPSKSYQKVQLANENETIKVGDDILFSGYPLSTPGMVTHHGMVSGFDQSGVLIFLQAAINKGNSGGAILNSNGHVAGIISMREGEISKGLSGLQQYIESISSQGNNVRFFGVDTLQATKEIIQTLDQYINTGIGYARSIKAARDYLKNHPDLIK